MKVARAALHFGEEPVITGKGGSGAVFFSHCPLKCVYCQNEKISAGGIGEHVTEVRLAKTLIRLQSLGACNINFVTGTHYAESIVRAVRFARAEGLSIPIVWNTSGYETEQTITMLDEIVDVFMPDFKYWDPATAKAYSRAGDYPTVASKAIKLMLAMRPHNSAGSDGTLSRGVLIRHLVLPDHTKEAKKILQWVQETAGSDALVSLMRQYTPMEQVRKDRSLGRTLHRAEYESVISYAERLGLRNVFIQEKSAADPSFIPEFYSALPADSD